MIHSNIYNYVNVLDKAADATWARSEVLSNNIANVNTPGFKRKDVEFEDYLLAALEGATDSRSLSQAVANLDLDGVQAVAYTDMSTLSYRLDGNNVDIDTENVEYASNQIKYNTLIDSMTHQFAMIRSALSTQ